MHRRNKKIILASLLFGFAATLSVAEGQLQCGSSSLQAAHADQSGCLLDDDFRSLLHPSVIATTTQQSAHPIVLGGELAPAAQNGPQIGNPGNDLIGTPVFKRRVVASDRSPMSSTRDARTCILKDAESQRELLTLTIPGDIQAETISAEELKERREAMRSLRRLPLQNSFHSAQQTFSPTPSLFIQRDESGTIKVESNNSDLRDVLLGLSTKTRTAIHFHPKLEGTISTSTKAESLVVLLRTMLEPFNFSVVAGADSLIVCGPDQTPGSVSAANATSPSSPQPLPLAQPTHQAVAAIAPVTSPEPPARTKAVTRRSAVGKKGPAAPPRVQVVADAPVSTVNSAPMQIQQHPEEVQLVSAELPRLPPKPRRAASKPMPRPFINSRIKQKEPFAAEQIVRVAQDAFAAGQPEYATEMLRQGLKRFPNSPMLHRMLGESLYLDGAFTEATQVLRQALTLDKHNATSNELMGKSLSALGNNQRASHYLLQAKECRRYAN